MPWTQEQVAGYPCEVFQPRQRHAAGYVVIYLHGVHGGRLSEQQAFTDEFERHGLTCVAPWTGRCWWTNRVCRDFDSQVTPQQHLLERVLPYIREAFDVEPPRVGLLGTSMGGQGALRLAYVFPDRFPVVSAISPAIDFQRRIEDVEEEDDPLLEMYPDPESARQETALLYIHPLNWPRFQFFCCDPTDVRWFDSSDRLRMKLSSLGVPFECDLETIAGGHGFQYYNHMASRAVQFLVKGLSSLPLRVV
jgi:pimeloyl-ACP methyl ester carboxylesterase